MVHFKSTPLFQIRLDEDTLIMRGSRSESVGCVLRGQLVLVITEQTKFKEIRLTFQGKSKVSWVDELGKGQYQHSEERIIFQHDWTFLPAEKQCHVLSPDNYHWDFELILPGTLPETIVGCQRGSLTYKLHAVAERTAFTPNLHTKRNVTLIRGLLPNSSEYTQFPIMANTWADKIEYEFSVGTKVFSPGDKIPISVKLRSLDNSFKIKDLICIFKEYVTYSVGTNQKTDSNRLNGIREFNYSNDPNYWNFTLDLLIPAHYCLYDTQNDTICVRHKLKFSLSFYDLRTKDRHYELKASLPIIITLDNDSMNLPVYDENYLSTNYDNSENTLLRTISSSSSSSSTFSSPCCYVEDIEEMNKLPSYSSISSSIPIPLADSSLPPTYDASTNGNQI